MTGFYLALDQGGHASRALIFDHEGQLAAREAVPIQTLTHANGHIEHDPEELVASLVRASAGACAQLPAGVRPLAAGLATQRSSLVCWHRQSGAALSPVISWQDRRHARWLAHLAGHERQIRQLTGLVLSPHYGASKMRWCLDNLPAVQRAAADGELVMGPLASFLTCRLACRLVTGHPVVADPANASRTLLWALETRDWSPALLQLFGIPAGVLPATVTTRHDYGNLTTPRGPVPLRIVTGDQSAVPFAFGPLDPATAYVNLGTGAFVQRPVAGRVPEAPELLVSVVRSDRQRVDYLLEGTVNGAGSALDWLADRLATPVDGLLAAAQAAASGVTEPPLFLNGVSGLGAPWWRSDFPSRFINDGADESPGSQLRAVFESIAFMLQTNLEQMTPWCPPLQRVLVTGGLSANDYLCRCLATLCRVPVLRVTDPEATARGLAALVADQASRVWRAPGGEPIAGPAVPGLQARYARWRAAMPAL